MEIDAFPAQRSEQTHHGIPSAESADGKVLGALGSKSRKNKAGYIVKVHRLFPADHLRPLLWTESMPCDHHGLFRLWTQKRPFWNHSGLSKPDAEPDTKLPAVWRSSPAIGLHSNSKMMSMR